MSHRLWQQQSDRRANADPNPDRRAHQHDPPHTLDTMDSAIAELAALRHVAVDADDLVALQDVLAELSEMRRQLDV